MFPFSAQKAIDMWANVAKTIIDNANGHATIIYMDFVSNVHQLLGCFDKLNITAKPYTGKGMTAEQKAKVVQSFRYIE